MARVIVDERTVVVKPWWARVRIVFIGASLGLIWWILTALLRVYVVEPVACRDLSNAATCVDAYGVAGSIAAIIAAIIGVFMLIRTLHPRPIVIAVATAAVLWTLGHYVSGLAWYESVLWAVVLYAATYVLFGMVARIVWFPAAAATAIITVVAIRLLLVI